MGPVRAVQPVAQGALLRAQRQEQPVCHFLITTTKGFQPGEAGDASMKLESSNIHDGFQQRRLRWPDVKLLLPKSWRCFWARHCTAHCEV